MILKNFLNSNDKLNAYQRSLVIIHNGVNEQSTNMKNIKNRLRKHECKISYNNSSAERMKNFTY